MNNRQKKKLHLNKANFKKWKDLRFNLIIHEIACEFELSRYHYLIKRKLNKHEYYILLIDAINDIYIYAYGTRSYKHNRAFKLDCSIYDIFGSIDDILIRTTEELKITVKTHCKKKYYDSKKRYRLNKS